MESKLNKYMQLKHFVFVLIYIGVVGSFGIYLLSCSTPEGPANLSVSETTYDCGKVSEEQSVSHTFIIHNTGAGPLVIKGVEPDCECTVPTYDKIIPPGGHGKITLGIKPFSLIEAFKKNTRVFTNDPNKPEVILTLQGVSEPLVTIQPSHIIRLQGNPGQNVTAQVRIVSRLTNPFKVDYFQTSIPDKIDLSLQPEKPGKSYLLEIKNKFKEKGSYSGKIEIFSNFKKRPRLILRVFGNFQGPVAADSSMRLLQGQGY
jgi:hypothetical protein